MTATRPIHLRVRVVRDDWTNEYTACKSTRPATDENATDDPAKVTCKACLRSHHMPGNGINYRGRW